MGLDVNISMRTLQATKVTPAALTHDHESNFCLAFCDFVIATALARALFRGIQQVQLEVGEVEVVHS